MQRAQPLKAESSEEETNRLLGDYTLLNDDVVETTGRSVERSGKGSKFILI